MNKYCYALVHKNTNALLIESEKLPIFWYLRRARERLKGFPDYRIEKVLLKELHKFILTYPY